MKFRKFKFISFEEWDTNGREYKTKIGDYTCRIGFLCQVNKNYLPEKYVYKIAISKNENPLSYYSDSIFSDVFEWDIKNKEALKKWYKEAIKNANKEWTNFMMKKYINV